MWIKITCWLPRRFLTRLMFFITRISRPRFFARGWIRWWMKYYHILLDDFIIPEGGFKHFNQFHLRELKPGARPIGNAPIIFPCDGIVTAFGKIAPQMHFDIKGNRYQLPELIGEATPSFADGNFVSIYLPVYSYHWWHAPMDATVQQCRVIGGDYMTVAEIAQEKIPDLFVKNHRMVEYYHIAGECRAMLVAVAAFMVGTILSTYERKSDGVTRLHLPVQKGQKMGGFAFGSSVLLFLPPESRFGTDLKIGSFYRMGQPLSE